MWIWLNSLVSKAAVFKKDSFSSSYNDKSGFCSIIPTIAKGWPKAKNWRVGRDCPVPTSSEEPCYYWPLAVGTLSYGGPSEADPERKIQEQVVYCESAPADHPRKWDRKREDKQMYCLSMSRGWLHPDCIGDTRYKIMPQNLSLLKSRKLSLHTWHSSQSLAMAALQEWIPRYLQFSGSADRVACRPRAVLWLDPLMHVHGRGCWPEKRPKEIGQNSGRVLRLLPWSLHPPPPADNAHCAGCGGWFMCEPD